MAKALILYLICTTKHYGKVRLDWFPATDGFTEPTKIHMANMWPVKGIQYRNKLTVSC